ncbi:MAG: hypothetical protein WDN27_04215 [Candidatus Saccharibacteria bacterium]
MAPPRPVSATPPGTSTPTPSRRRWTEATRTTAPAIGGAETVGATNLCNQTVTLGTPITFTDTVNVAAGQTAKYLCATLAFSPPSSTTTGNGRSTASCVAVAFQPFLSILGGDVVAGANPCGTGGSTTANITSWNSDSGSFYGAGSQLGALATGTMTSFASGLGTGSVTGSSLSFANTSVSPPNYGGSFGTMPCIPDYAGSSLTGATTGPSPLNLSSLAANTTTCTSTRPMCRYPVRYHPARASRSS